MEKKTKKIMFMKSIKNLKHRSILANLLTNCRVFWRQTIKLY